MSQFEWPFLILIPSDVVGIWAIVSQATSEETITGGIIGAYIGCGLAIGQLPFLLYGYMTSKKLKNKVYERAYIAHMIMTGLICLGANIPWHHVLLRAAHLLAGS